MPPFYLLPALLPGLWITLMITAGGIVVAAIAAFLAGLARVSRHRWLNIPALIYIDLFRGTSALVQLFWAYFVLPLWGIELNALVVGILVLGLNIGAYGAEVVRSAIEAVPTGQTEAAIALNFSETQTMWRIIFPQALPAMLPTFGNLSIELLKSTALVSTISLSELTFKGQILRSATFRSAEIFTLILFLYFIVAQAIAWGFRRLERRFNVGRDYGGLR